LVGHKPQRAVMTSVTAAAAAAGWPACCHGHKRTDQLPGPARPGLLARRRRRSSWPPRPVRHRFTVPGLDDTPAPPPINSRLKEASKRACHAALKSESSATRPNSTERTNNENSHISISRHVARQTCQTFSHLSPRHTVCFASGITPTTFGLAGLILWALATSLNR